MSKTSANVSSGNPNTKKQMKARGRRPSAFIVLRCSEPLMKHKARVFDMTSQSRRKIQCNKACKINVFPSGMVNSSCKSLPVFWKPLSHVSSVLLHSMVMAEKKKNGISSRFRLPKSAPEERVLADENKNRNGWPAKGDESTDLRLRWSFQRLWIAQG